MQSSRILFPHEYADPTNPIDSIDCTCNFFTLCANKSNTRKEKKSVESLMKLALTLVCTLRHFRNGNNDTELINSVRLTCD